MDKKLIITIVVAVLIGLGVVYVIGLSGGSSGAAVVQSSGGMVGGC